MKTPDTIYSKKEEFKSTNFKVEHLPELDIVLNMDYPIAEDRETILASLRGRTPVIEGKYFEPFLSEIFKNKETKDPKSNPRFFVKLKKFANQKDIDFTLGRDDEEDTVRMNQGIMHDFNKKSLYALNGVLNEIILSEKIKKVIASKDSQDLVKKYGFAGITFSEPIMAILEKKYNKKYLVYKFIKKDDDSFISPALVNDLRKIFLANEIEPHDLQHTQFTITIKNDQRHLTLSDVEAFTKK